MHPNLAPLGLALVIGLAGPGSAPGFQAGEPCSHPGGEVCSTAVDADGDGLVGCLDPDCSPALCGLVCGAGGVLGPPCRPLLDDPAKLRFKYPKRLDQLKLAARGIPVTPLDPGSEAVQLVAYNASGTIFSEVLPAGSYVANAKGTRWKYKQAKTGVPEISASTIAQRFDKTLGVHEYLLKFKAEADAAAADPARTVGPTEDELRTITVQVSIGPNVFYVTAEWERVPGNVTVPVKGWKLTDKYMQNL